MLSSQELRSKPWQFLFAEQSNATSSAPTFADKVISILPSLCFLIGCILFYPFQNCPLCDAVGATSFTLGSALLTYASSVAWNIPCCKPAMRIIFNMTFFVGSVAFFPVLDAAKMGCWLFTIGSAGFLFCQRPVFQLDYFFAMAGYILFVLGSLFILYETLDYTDCIHLYVIGSICFIVSTLLEIRQQRRSVAPFADA